MIWVYIALALFILWALWSENVYGLLVVFVGIVYYRWGDAIREYLEGFGVNVWF